jgi:hypothetical protein
MQIAVTKKLAEAIGIAPVPADEAANPLFSWTSNLLLHNARPLSMKTISADS